MSVQSPAGPPVVPPEVASGAVRSAAEEEQTSRSGVVRKNGPLFWLTIALLTVIFIGPLLWMLGTAFKSENEARSVPLTWLPSSLNTTSFSTLFDSDDSPILLWLGNSLLAASLHALLVIVVCSLAGYALARLDFPGKRIMFGLIIGTLFLPGFIFLMPNFLTLNEIGWLDTVWALVVPGAAGAFGVFFMRQFFLGIPVEFEESARIDGAGPFRTFFSIILPNARPAVATLAVLSFLANWNDFIWPIYVLFSPERLTLPVGLSKLQGAYTINYPVIMAGACLAAFPVLIVYSLSQRYIIEGVASSGIKG
ncbi:carbohydrate ABC transporter permease [Nakamurella sp. A5-74]|uniref:Carbohydrate ABC transporter permease n=1 Tax=Nakamurella sp. A5-74 TaxID=3158264 RepID=A0AAU8DRQ7_9ACTN